MTIKKDKTTVKTTVKMSEQDHNKGTENTQSCDSCWPQMEAGI